MFATTLFALLLMFLASVAAANAQTSSDPGKQPDTSQIQPWFDASGLKVGNRFPAAEIYDEAGRPFNTRSLKGQYTIVVNGCLT